MTMLFPLGAWCPSHSTNTRSVPLTLTVRACPDWRHTFGQRYLAISLIIAQSALRCSLFALADSLSKFFFGGLCGSGVGGRLAFANCDCASVVEGAGELFPAGSFLSNDWYRHGLPDVNMRS